MSRTFKDDIKSKLDLLPPKEETIQKIIEN